MRTRTPLPRALPLLFLLLLCASTALCRAEPLGEALAEAAAVPRADHDDVDAAAEDNARDAARDAAPLVLNPGIEDAETLDAETATAFFSWEGPALMTDVNGGVDLALLAAWQEAAEEAEKTRVDDAASASAFAAERAAGMTSASDFFYPVDRVEIEEMYVVVTDPTPALPNIVVRTADGGGVDGFRPNAGDGGFTVIVPRDDAWMTDPHHASPATVIRIDVWNLLLCAVIGIVLAVAMLSLVSAWTERHGGGGGGDDDRDDDDDSDDDVEKGVKPSDVSDGEKLLPPPPKTVSVGTNTSPPMEASVAAPFAATCAPKCYECGQPGHWARDCWHSTGGV